MDLYPYPCCPIAFSTTPTVKGTVPLGCLSWLNGPQLPSVSPRCQVRLHRSYQQHAGQAAGLRHRPAPVRAGRAPPGEAPGTLGETSLGALGSPGYMDPALLRANKSSAYTVLNEIFSFGVVLAEMFCGRSQLFEDVDLFTVYFNEEDLDIMEACDSRGGVCH